MKQFNTKFTEQVKRAFANHNTDHLADKGWNALQRKRKKSHRFAIVLPLWAKAASIAALTITLSGVITYHLINTETTLEITQVEIDKPSKQVDLDKSQKEDTSVKTTIAADKKIVASQRPKEPTKKRATKQLASAEVKDDSHTDEVELNALVTLEKEENENEKDSDSQQDDYKEVLKKPKPEEIEEVETSEKQAIVLEPFIISEPEKTQARKTSVFAGVSGMMAKVEDMISKAPGVSVGLYAEHRITNRIAVRPGVALTKQTYGLESLTNSNDFLYASNYASADLANVTFFENHFDVVAMEIPLNVVFSISERQDKKLYMTVGMSSLVFLSQTYSGSFEDIYYAEVYDDDAQEWVTTQYVNKNSYNEHYDAFSHMDFFGLANISAGYSLPISKNSTLLVEPFVQLPIGKITSNNLQIYFGGLSMKLKLGR